MGTVFQRLKEQRSLDSELSGEAAQPPKPQPPLERFLPPEGVEDAVSVLTWNVAAVNNNPFEYWLSYDDPKYLDLMTGVECFLDDPGTEDVEVGEIFSEAMFLELKELLEREGMESLDEVEQMWRGGEMNMTNRRIISEFVKDRSLGAKRLISMPDRVTNTIHVVTRKESLYQPPPACRPSVMNNFEGDLSTTEVWWEQWKKFMFQDALTVRTKEGCAVLRPVQMLEPIPRSKYPAVTEQEERLSIPLQILCQAIFDAIVVHLMNLLSPEDEWQVVKSTICDRLFRHKHVRTVQILAETYGNVDIMCLQEVAGVFKDHFRDSSLAHTHTLVTPDTQGGMRDQNSVMIVSNKVFDPASIRDVSPALCGLLAGGQRLAGGDLLAVEARARRDGKLWLIISFHGETSGLQTVPVADAISRALQEEFMEHTLVFGLDANLYEVKKEGVQDFAGCLQRLGELGLASCWGPSPEVSACRTTCSARTSLQPQLNKAVRFAERVTKGGREPKDLVVFGASQLAAVSPEGMGPGRQPNPMKDNTGNLEYKEDTVFPTLDFPSDHGILAVVLRPVVK